MSHQEKHSPKPYRTERLQVVAPLREEEHHRRWQDCAQAYVDAQFKLVRRPTIKGLEAEGEQLVDDLKAVNKALRDLGPSLKDAEALENKELKESTLAPLKAAQKAYVTRQQEVIARQELIKNYMNDIPVVFLEFKGKDTGVIHIIFEHENNPAVQELRNKLAMTITSSKLLADIKPDKLARKITPKKWAEMDKEEFTFSIEVSKKVGQTPADRRSDRGRA